MPIGVDELTAESKCKHKKGRKKALHGSIIANFCNVMGNLFHFLSIMHTWTDSATFGAIDHHVLWIFFAFTGQCPEFTTFVFILAS